MEALLAMEHTIRQGIHNATSTYRLMGWDALPGKIED